MAKLVKTGYTDCYGSVVQVTILSYDNNKRVQVRKPDGAEDTLLRGYVMADPELKRPISAVNWHIHGGGTRKTYRGRRKQKQTYSLNRISGGQAQFRSKARAVAEGVAQAMALGQVISVNSDVLSLRRSGMRRIGWANIECCPDGTAVQHGSRARRPGSVMPKRLRGYGKLA